MSWLDDKRAPFVIAAYAVAALILIGLLLVSVWQNKKSRAKLQQMQEQLKKP